MTFLYFQKEPSLKD